VTFRCLVVYCLPSRLSIVCFDVSPLLVIISVSYLLRRDSLIALLFEALRV
jgi:hypothetical protein